MNRPRRKSYPRMGPGEKFKKFSRKSLTVPKMSHSAHSLSSYIAEHAQLVPKTEELSAAYQNGARKALKFRQPIRLKHEKTLQHRQPIRIEYYVNPVVSQSELSITPPESFRLAWRSLLDSRLESARYSLS